MTEPLLTRTRFENGIWQGHLRTPTQPDIQVLYRGEDVDGVSLSDVEDGWTVTIPVPVAALSDGVHSFVISERSTARKLGDFTVISGEPAADDLRAEVELLRGELDMLKRAFRRICREPS
ncbi:hypothetical protein J7394_02910 [Ruegeria sp. R13_0]|uniref:hypothetical protein n=1 Tax=Ruegeria sp. R13_0 TaxID=2821099 RepID=UPI001ADD34D1|nr:hypothetical protein [Ruegeria sp. R13_0]MBO9433139.1 hypothetical protein [Ruegeria sp. R13_0]